MVDLRAKLRENDDDEPKPTAGPHRSDQLASKSTQNVTPTRRPLPRWFAAGFWLAGIGSIAAFVCMVAIAIDMVRSSRGLETYRTFWLVELNWVAFLVFVAVAGVALLVGLALRIRQNRDWQRLK